MLRIEKLRCSYGDAQVLFNVGFQVEANKKLIVVGPNGCGKTTLLKAIAGLIPYDGEIEIDDDDVSKLSKKEQSKKMALLAQTSAIHFSYSVYETVMQGRYVHLKDGFFKGESARDKEVVRACLETVGLLDLQHKDIHELSGGQLQRVFLARVFAQEPDVILLDEPTNHLDLRYQLELMTYLDQWVKKPGRLVVGVFHDMNLALSFADEIIMLKEGKVFAHQSVETLDLDLIDETFDVEVRDYMRTSLKKWER